RAQRPQVGPVVDAVRRIPVVAPVPGQERDAPAGDLRHRERVRRLAVRGGERDLPGVLGQRVEAAAADDPDLRDVVHVSLSSSPGWPRRSRPGGPRRPPGVLLACRTPAGPASARRARGRRTRRAGWPPPPPARPGRRRGAPRPGSRATGSPAGGSTSPRTRTSSPRPPPAGPPAGHGGGPGPTAARPATRAGQAAPPRRPPGTGCRRRR